MRTGVSYLGSCNPRHVRMDMEEMQRLRLDDVFLCALETDFIYFPGKIEFTAKFAADHGIRPIILFYGALNLFGGGRSSQFLLEHPEAFQIGPGGAHIPAACVNNPLCLELIERQLDQAADCGFEGYMIDEPSTTGDCRCLHCRERFADWMGGDLDAAPDDARAAFRDQSAVAWICAQTDLCKARHPRLETIATVVPSNRRLWAAIAGIPSLDNLGTNVYLCNRDVEIETMREPVREMAALCRRNGKKHHEWLQCFRVASGREPRIRPQGEILLEERPDGLYVWGHDGRVGSKESCENPELAWAYATEILLRAK